MTARPCKPCAAKRKNAQPKAVKWQLSGGDLAEPLTYDDIPGAKAELAKHPGARLRRIFVPLDER